MSKGQQTRQEIVRKAAALFNRKGYEGTALSDLMNATGLQKGGIYRHFGSKEELAAEAFDYAWRTAFEVRQKGVEERLNTLDRLKQMVRNFAEQREGLVPGGCPLLNTAIDADDGNAVLRTHARKAMKQWLTRLRSLVAEGKRRGEIKASADPERLAALIAGTLEGALMISRLNRTDEPLSWAQQHLEAHLEQQRQINAAESQEQSSHERT
jgi:TetR/AcrR family transcriptional regulator, transcriptional repressor for nem operon